MASFPTSSITATGPSSSTAATVHNPPASQPSQPVGSLAGHSVAAVEPNREYRFDSEGGWTSRNASGGWDPIGSFPNEKTPLDVHSLPVSHPDDLKAFTVVAQHSSRINIIDEQIAAYEEELRQEELRQAEVKNPSPESSDRIVDLKHLIAMWKTAKSYHNDMQKHLESKDYSKVGLQANLSEYLFKINASPNKIERMAHQLAVHLEALVSDQALLRIVEAKIDDYRQDGHQPPQDFLDTRKVLQERITHRRALMEATAAYAELLPPPYEARDEATQAALDQQALTCRRELSLITRSILFRPDHPDLNVAFCNNYEMEARQRSAAEAAREARQRSAAEAARPQPREELSDLLIRSADLYQQAADAYTTGDTLRGDHLRDAAHALSRAAAGARKPQPQVLLRLNQVADLHQRAAAAYETSDTRREIFLSLAADALSRAADEAGLPQPLAELSDLLTRSADLYQQADDAYARGDTRRGDHLRDAARALSRAAAATQKPQPEQATIDAYKREAQENIDRAERLAACCSIS